MEGVAAFDWSVESPEPPQEARTSVASAVVVSV
jgi:hypothetical protein